MNSLWGREMDSGYHAQASRGWNPEILLSKIVENSRNNSLSCANKSRFRIGFTLGKGGKVGVPLPPSPLNALTEVRP
jgi:hypothetical protein